MSATATATTTTGEIEQSPSDATATASSDPLLSQSLADLEKEEEILHRDLVVFGQDIGNIPCFRNSFLYGIVGGFSTGIGHFALSSKIRSATQFGFYSYVAITACYWVQCRYNYSVTKFKYTQLQHAMQRNALFEGTEADMTKTAQS